MNQELNPQDKPDEPAPEDKVPEPEVKPTEPSWFEKAGFNDEATAQESVAKAQKKISEQGRELSEYRRAQTQAPVEPSAQPNEPTVTAESFFENPAAAIATASEASSRKVLEEFRLQQQNDRMIEQAATDAGVERHELENMYHELNNDPKKAVQYLAAIAAAQKGKVQAQDVRTAMDEVAENKSRATGTVAGSHVPVDTEPDWENMTYPEAMKKMAELGMITPEKIGLQGNV